jgi:hypothetical protein
MWPMSDDRSGTKQNEDTGRCITCADIGTCHVVACCAPLPDDHPGMDVVCLMFGEKIGVSTTQLIAVDATSAEDRRKLYG